MKITATNISLNSSHDFFKQRNRKVDFAILSAMPEELEFFQHFFSQNKCENIAIDGFKFKVYEYNNKRILLSHTGLGTTFAASVVTLIHQRFSPSYILFSGTAGGINPHLKICDVVIVEKAFEAEIQGAFKLLKGTPFEDCLTHPLAKQHFPPIYSADQELLNIATEIASSASNVHKGTVVSSNTFPAPQELFDRIKSENPYSIDMETSAIYQVAWLLKMRVIAVRGISNILNTNGTDDKIHESDVKGSANAAAKVVLNILDALLLKYDLRRLQEGEIKSTVDNEVSDLVNFFKLQPHPEGGYYARTFQSADTVKSTDINRYNNEDRTAGTSIYYLLKGNDFSAWHRLKSDEMWHYYKGSAVNIHVIDKHGVLTTYLLGDPTIISAATFQVAITADNWFSAELIDKASYCLVGCTVTPGFEFRDFELADRNSLSTLFPQHELIISQFTRLAENQINSPVSEQATRMRSHL